MEVNFWETVRESPTFIVLFGCSLLVVTFIIERWLYFRRTTLDANAFVSAIYKNMQSGGPRACLHYCQTLHKPLALVVRAGLENLALGEKRVKEMMEATALEEKIKLERFLSILGTMGNIAPFIGLLGTVIGIIRAFHDLAVSGSGGPSVVAAGISEALIATAAGLFVAIPSAIAYNFFLRRVGTIMAEIEAATRKVRVIIGIGQMHEQAPAEEAHEEAAGTRHKRTSRVSSVRKATSV